MQNRRHRHLYSAYANSVTAVLDDPLKAFLANGPSAALAPHGGLNSHTQEDIKLHIDTQHILRIGRASATTQGVFHNGEYLTLATSSVEKLNILDVVTADLIVGRVVSVLPPEEEWKKYYPGEEYCRQPYFFGGSHFQNLRIDGKLIECEVHPDFRQEHGHFIKKDETEPRSLFNEHCHPIHIRQFGTIHLGEMQRYASKVILTMLSVELGSPTGGDVQVSTTSANNPPPPKYGK